MLGFVENHAALFMSLCLVYSSGAMRYAYCTLQKLTTNGLCALSRSVGVAQSRPAQSLMQNHAELPTRLSCRQSRRCAEALHRGAVAALSGAKGQAVLVHR